MRTRFIAASAIALPFSVSLPAFAADYYFDSVAGNDQSDGTSESTAKKTLKIPSGSGNTIHIKRGSSFSGGLSLSNVTVTTYGEGDRPIINGSINVSNSVVEGLCAKPTSGNGFNANGNATIQDCEVDGNTGGAVNVGFGIMGQNNKIIGNYVHDLGWSQSGGSMDNSGGAEAFMVMASNNEVAFNSAVNCQSENATLGGKEGGCLEIVNGKAGSTISNVTFHHNYCEKSVGLWEGCSGDFSASGGGIQENHGIIENVTVSYNLSIDSMWIFLLQPVNTDFRNCVFAHNTIVHTAKSAEYWDSGGGHFSMALAVGTYTNNDTGTKYVTNNEYYTEADGFATGTIILKNNIFVDDIPAGSSSFGGGRNMMFMTNVADHSNNLFVPADASVGSLKLNDTEKKVALADLAFTADWRLTADSKAAIDQGAVVGMTGNGALAVSELDAGLFETTFNQDIDKHAVPCGSGPDIGASEFCEGAGGAAATGGSSATTKAGTATGKGGSTSTTSSPAKATGGNQASSGSDSSSTDAGSDEAGGSAATSGSGETGQTSSSGGSTGKASAKASGTSSKATGSASKDGEAGGDETDTSGEGGGNSTAVAGTGAGAPELGGCNCRVDAQATPATARLGLLALVAGLLLKRRRQHAR